MSFDLKEMKHKLNQILSKDFILMTAPLEDVTDSVYRTLAHKYGADITFTEMTRLEGLARKNKSTWSRIKIPDNTPTQIQIIGSSESSLKKFLRMYEPENGFLGFNLNLGCPSPEMINYGYGCAMIKRVTKVKKMVSIIKSYGYPCSIKLRLGMNQFEKDKKTYLNLVNSVDADFFIIHTRHGNEFYDTPADYSVIDECVATKKIIIINGDVKTVEQINLLRRKGARGAMIGRAAIPNMALFNELKGENILSMTLLKQEYLELAEMRDSKYRYRENILKRIN